MVVKDMVDKTWRVVPLKMVPVCVAKYDLCLREAALRAVQAMHTILGRMVPCL